MYVADRDTLNDAFCGECGNMTNTTDMDRYKGLCEECHIIKDYPFLWRFTNV